MDIIAGARVFASIHVAHLRSCKYYECHKARYLGKLAEEISGGRSTFETELDRVKRELEQVKREGQNLAETVAQGDWMIQSAIIQKKLQEVTERQAQLLAERARLEQESASRFYPLPNF